MLAVQRVDSDKPMARSGGVMVAGPDVHDFAGHEHNVSYYDLSVVGVNGAGWMSGADWGRKGLDREPA